MIDAGRERYANLATFRKNGQEVKTPVWIAAGGGNTYVYTNVTSGKVKRIRNNGRARVAPSDMRGNVKGDWVDAKARVIEDGEGRDRGINALVAKYGWQMRLALFLSRFSGRYKERAIIELELADVFDRARVEGFRVVAHAGEEGPSEYVWQALDNLGAERIDHGVRAVDDDELVERLRADRIPLTVCPLSNVKLRVFDKLEDHNLKDLLDLGLRATVNSDDPSYFGGYIGDNFLAVADALGLGPGEIERLVRNSIDAAFVDAARKDELHKEVDAFLAQQ